MGQQKLRLSETYIFLLSARFSRGAKRAFSVFVFMILRELPWNIPLMSTELMNKFWRSKLHYKLGILPYAPFLWRNWFFRWNVKNVLVLAGSSASATTSHMLSLEVSPLTCFYSPVLFLGHFSQP